MDSYPGRSFAFLFLFFSFLSSSCLCKFSIPFHAKALDGDYLQKGEESDWSLHIFPPCHGLSHMEKTNDQNVLCT